jgi:putative N-acetylmannosamine-6-phosphate epimerase
VTPTREAAIATAAAEASMAIGGRIRGVRDAVEVLVIVDGPLVGFARRYDLAGRRHKRNMRIV